MNRSSLFVMVAMMAVVLTSTIWMLKRFIQPPTLVGKKRLTVFLRFVGAQYIIITLLVLLTVEHVVSPRMLGILGLANFVCSFLILWVALKRAPFSDQDITREQRARAIKTSKVAIAIYVICLVGGLLQIGELPLIGIIVGVAVNVLIVVTLITNLRRNQAKLDQSNNC